MSKQANITPLTPPSKDTATLPAILDMCPSDDQSALVWRTHYWSILHSEQANSQPCSAKLIVAYDGSIELTLYWPHMSVKLPGYHSWQDIAVFMGLNDIEPEWIRDEREERRLAADYRQRKEQAEKEEAQRRLIQSGPAGQIATHARRF